MDLSLKAGAAISVPETKTETESIADVAGKIEFKPAGLLGPALEVGNIPEPLTPICFDARRVQEMMERRESQTRGVLSPIIPQNVHGMSFECLHGFEEGRAASITLEESAETAWRLTQDCARELLSSKPDINDFSLLERKVNQLEETHAAARRLTEELAAQAAKTAETTATNLYQAAGGYGEIRLKPIVDEKPMISAVLQLHLGGFEDEARFIFQVQSAVGQVTNGGIGSAGDLLSWRRQWNDLATEAARLRRQHITALQHSKVCSTARAAQTGLLSQERQF